MVFGDVGACSPSQDQIKGERERATSASLMSNRVTLWFESDDNAFPKISEKASQAIVTNKQSRDVPDHPEMTKAETETTPWPIRTA